jgi:hypothetical protein
MRNDWQEVQRTFDKAQKRVEKAAENDLKIVFETKMEMLRKFHTRSEKGTPRVETPHILGVILPVGGNAGRQPLPAPPLLLALPKEPTVQPRQDSYVDFFRRAFRNLGENIPENRQIVISNPDKAIELHKALSKRAAGSDAYIPIL